MKEGLIFFFIMVHAFAINWVKLWESNPGTLGHSKACLVDSYLEW